MAVGFVDTKVKVGIGPVGVGNREVEPLALPTALEAAAAVDEAAEETAEAT
jgi:hypothetical protein